MCWERVRLRLDYLYRDDMRQLAPNVGHNFNQDTLEFLGAGFIGTRKGTLLNLQRIYFLLALYLSSSQ